LSSKIPTINGNHDERSNYKHFFSLLLYASNSRIAPAYEKMFQTIRILVTNQGALNINPKTCTVGFEKGLHKGFSRVFPEVQLIGCLFHFKQALHRFAAKKGLKKAKYYQLTRRVIAATGRICWLKKPVKHLNQLEKKL